MFHSRYSVSQNPESLTNYSLAGPGRVGIFWLESAELKVH